MLGPALWRDYRAVLGAPKVLRHLPLKRLRVNGVPPAELRRRLAARRAGFDKGETAIFVLYRRADGAAVGLGGFNRLDHEHKTGEFGLALAPAAWGSGAAAEFHLIGLGYGFRVLGLHRVEFVTARENVRMRGFFEKSGIPLESVKREATRTGRRWTDNCVYALLASRWPAVRRRLLARARRQAR